jgi:spermidine synthase
MYFQRDSGCGLALMRKIPRHRVGLIGLGAGTLAAYGNPGDVYRFYEINPLVISLANSEFSFLKDSKAHIDVVLGDARISLEREPDQGFDTLVIDAFSGDAIPVHLLTREAFRCYLRHLKPGGIIAVHITNRYLDLSHLLDRVAREFGKEAWIFGATTSTQWVLISDDQACLRSLASEKAASRIENTGIRLWTDQYSNLFSVLR